jgi:hypothetical protein
VDFQRVVSKELQTGMVDAQGYVVYLDDLGVLYFRRSTGAMSDQVSAPLPSGAYHHVVAAFTGSLIVLYVDGVAVDGKPSVLSIPDHDGAFTFGSKSDTFAPFAGTIDEMAVYGHALDAARVQVHHALGIMP